MKQMLSEQKTVVFCFYDFLCGHRVSSLFLAEKLENISILYPGPVYTKVLPFCISFISENICPYRLGSENAPAKDLSMAW